MNHSQKVRLADRFEEIGASKGDLCRLYECDFRTLKSWLEPIADQLQPYKRRYTPRQVGVVFGFLERPRE